MQIKGLALVAGLAVAGCHASVNAELASGGAHQEVLDEGAPGPAAKEPLAGNKADLQKAPADNALLGARHDLHLAGRATTPACTCLAATVGQPNDPAFVWEAGMPALDPDSQLVVALGSGGVKCDASIPKDSLGASYWGYRHEGNDVIVIVENARFGRPITRGAVIPRPAPGGHVYIQPANKRVPYGRPLDGSGHRCKLL